MALVALVLMRVPNMKLSDHLSAKNKRKKKKKEAAHHDYKEKEEKKEKIGTPIKTHKKYNK